MNHLFVINPKAGKTDRSAELRMRVDKLMSKRNETYKIATTDYPEHAIEIVRKVVSDGEPWRVYACGGDGTLNEVVNGAVGYSNVEVTHYPCGTGNDFIKLFGRHQSKFYSLEELADGESMEFDLIKCMDRHSINICSVGLDARVAGDVHLFSKLPYVKPQAAFTISAAYNLFKGISRSYKIDIDGEILDGVYTMAVAANSRFYGGGYNPIPEANPTDGVLDFLLIKRVNVFQVATMIKKYADGKSRELGEVAIFRKGKSMKVLCENGEDEINVDGEILKSDNICLELSDKRIKFFGPKGCFDF
ncbi:MAG: diacylglycerol/lipid kinase family protein [Eubacteriales bacterium]|jgi:diacylglycerol kinase (ATP)